MPTDRIFLVGAGGHGKVVLDAMLAAGVAPARIEVRDDAPPRPGARLMGFEISGPVAERVTAGDHFHLAIGNADVRARLWKDLSALEAKPFTVVHPAAIVSPTAEVGRGVFVAATAVVAPSAQVGDATIVNHGAIVDHDCVVGIFCHIAPNATLGGGAKVGAFSMLGAGAVILPGVQIGSRVVVGAGAVVTKNVEDGGVVVGIPATRRR